MLKLKRKTIILILITASFVIALSLYTYFDKGILIVELKDNNNYVIEISSSYDWEIARPIYCKVTKENKTVVPLQGIGGTFNDLDDLRFELIRNERAGVVGVVEMANPYVVLFVFDYKNKVFWPNDPANKDIEKYYNKGRGLVNLLNTKDTNTPFVLSADVPGNVRTRVSY